LRAYGARVAEKSRDALATPATRSKKAIKYEYLSSYRQGHPRVEKVFAKVPAMKNSTDSGHLHAAPTGRLERR
jgi:hypothetical protein